ncbi:uncharacterized protein [Solanum tuberosum]|uniref:uncharacterized protein n=1 Tax=Solanum tuberosum TaxID=4113 RepID=UPI00073A3E70|nr:PREDICTED: uncharacterized protein LOC107060445 [Solanum tuberosum]
MANGLQNLEENPSGCKACFKSVADGILMKFKAWIENKSGCKIQVIRLDNGTEYTSDMFNSCCEEAGIEHQLTVPYSPQQNGTAYAVKRENLDKKADLRIFIGYSLFSEAYRIFQPQSNKIMVSRDVQLLKDEQWEWNEESQVKNHNSQLDYDDLVDDQPIRGTRSLSDIYERCNVVVFEPAGYEEEKMDQNLTNAMKEELTVIEKNQTWKLVERP